MGLQCFTNNSNISSWLLCWIPNYLKKVWGGGKKATCFTRNFRIALSCLYPLRNCHGQLVKDMHDYLTQYLTELFCCLQHWEQWQALVKEPVTHSLQWFLRESNFFKLALKWFLAKRYNQPEKIATWKIH